MQKSTRMKARNYVRPTAKHLSYETHVLSVYMFSSAVSSINKVDVEYHSEIQSAYMQSPETGWHMVSGPIEAVVTACRPDANVLDHQQHDYSEDVPANAH
ncbi:hypothetical protein CTI12_AA283960 [Artemisia annua]|uniref:Uncharacterized protein n=1 Tax=Artemisia annua TaxID=35608 RepID=A0A2U1NC16_ARTAN|nr:hypothetical protein CTI12_AA283960 [Artemisia annua]